MSALAIATRNAIAQPMQETDWRIARLFDTIWQDHFADVPRVNDLVTGFDFPWKWRLGRIRMSLDQRTTEITLNGLLDDPGVPHVVYVAILAHEIVHYAQGFGSPIDRQQRHAHAHGAVSSELHQRGLGHTETALERWGEEVWPHFRAQARATRRAARQQDVLTPCTVATKMVY